MKILPELLKSVEFGGGGPKAFGVVMKIASKISNDDFDTKITPVVIRLFGNPDRAIRVCLLDNLPHMIDRLSQKVVNDKIFPQIVGASRLQQPSDSALSKEARNTKLTTGVYSRLPDSQISHRL